MWPKWPKQPPTVSPQVLQRNPGSITESFFTCCGLSNEKPISSIRAIFAHQFLHAKMYLLFLYNANFILSTHFQFRINQHGLQFIKQKLECVRHVNLHNFRIFTQRTNMSILCLVPDASYTIFLAYRNRHLVAIES